MNSSFLTCITSLPPLFGYIPSLSAYKAKNPSGINNFPIIVRLYLFVSSHRDAAIYVTAYSTNSVLRRDISAFTDAITFSKIKFLVSITIVIGSNRSVNVRDSFETFSSLLMGFSYEASLETSRWKLFIILVHASTLSKLKFCSSLWIFITSCVLDIRYILSSLVHNYRPVLSPSSTMGLSCAGGPSDSVGVISLLVLRFSSIHRRFCAELARFGLSDSRNR